MTSPARPASFDSATAMVRATARFLRGQDFSLLGNDHPPWLRPALVATNLLPDTARRWLYRVGSGREALAPEVVASLSAEDLATHVVEQYPRRSYPGAMVGSTPGSVVHLCAALGVPLLPQTVLVPVRRRGVAPDDARGDVASAREVARSMLAANPELVLHQMFDPNGDRLTLSRFSYFRVKRTLLGPAYRKFLTQSLAPGATIFLVECNHRWPTTRVGDRHLFQFGGVGGVGPDELEHGSDRIATFLAREGSEWRSWDPPTPDGDSPEAEWGFDPALASDVMAFAEQNGYRVRRISFDHADDLSALVAELYRWWYARCGVPSSRLFVESFVLLDPWWVLRARAVPFWMTFNTNAGADTLERYLDGADPYEHIELTLVSNGIDAVGVPPMGRWQQLVDRATVNGRFAGVDRSRFPRDLAVFARYQDTLRSGSHWPLPEALEVHDLEGFLSEQVERYPVVVS